MTNKDRSMKVMQTEEARKEKSTPPEWIGNPGIHVIIVPRWRVIADNRRAFLIIIIINDCRFGVRRACWRLVLGILPRRIGQDR
jgi:hypothetical protein